MYTMYNYTLQILIQLLVGFDIGEGLLDWCLLRCKLFVDNPICQLVCHIILQKRSKEHQRTSKNKSKKIFIIRTFFSDFSSFIVLVWIFLIVYLFWFFFVELAWTFSVSTTQVRTSTRRKSKKQNKVVKGFFAKMYSCNLSCWYFFEAE